MRPPTIGEFAQQFGGSVMATEGALWRTLVLLFTRPGQLTREYLAGRRRHYVLPLRLYLTVSLVALLATQRVYGGRWWATLARNLAVALAYGVSLLLALGVVALWTLLG